MVWLLGFFVRGHSRLCWMTVLLLGCCIICRQDATAAEGDIRSRNVQHLHVTSTVPEKQTMVLTAAVSKYHPHHDLLRRDHQQHPYNDNHRLLPQHNTLRHHPTTIKMDETTHYHHLLSHLGNNKNNNDAFERERKLNTGPVYSCQVDTDCPTTGLICSIPTTTQDDGTVVGICVVAYCEEDIECPRGYLCDVATNSCQEQCIVEGNCPIPCKLDDDCPIINCIRAPCPPYTCDLNTNVCIQKFLGEACEMDGDCQPSGQEAFLWCHPELSLCVECRSDQDCSTGSSIQSVCEKGVCVQEKEDEPPLLCTNEWDCPNGYFCNTTLYPTPPCTAADGQGCSEPPPPLPKEQPPCDEATGADCSDAGTGDGTSSSIYGQCEQIACTSDRDCGGQLGCDTSTQLCVPIQCPSTTTACPNGLLCRKEIAVCVSCLSNDNCDFGLECSPTRHECVPSFQPEPWRCQSHSDCPVSTCLPGTACPFYSCDPESGQCIEKFDVECSSDDNDPCPHGYVCDASSNTCKEKCVVEGNCPISCQTNEECPVIQCKRAPCPPYTCDPNTNTCLREFLGEACEMDSDCQQQQQQPGKEDLLLWCHPELSVCVECRSDQECAGSIKSVCEKGVCVKEEKEEPPPLLCTNEWDCPIGYLCNATTVYVTPPCTTADGQGCSEPPPPLPKEQPPCDEATGADCSDAGTGDGTPSSSSSIYGRCEQIVCTSDRNCGSGQLRCDTSTQLCVPIQCSSTSPTCPNGLLCHTEMAVCVSCVSNDNCDFGLECSPTRHECVPSSEPDPWRCQSNSDCPMLDCMAGIACPFSICDPESGQCIEKFGLECSSDDHDSTCADHGMICNPDSGMCVFCWTNEQCESGFVCNTYYGGCVPDDRPVCRSDGDCPIPPCRPGGHCPIYTCNVETGRCVDVFGTKCSTDDGCLGGLFCDDNEDNSAGTTGSCVYCTNDEHCLNNDFDEKQQQICLNGQCRVPPCQSHSDCNNEQGYICDNYSRTCTQYFCFSDESCPKPGLFCNLTATKSNEIPRGVPCSPHVDCTDPTTTGGFCAPIPCTSNKDCGSSWWVCDAEHGHCARPKCSSAGACDDGLLCDKESGLCAACLSSDNCDSRWMCDSFLGECVPDYSHGGCHSDADCPQIGCAVPVGDAPDMCPQDITYVCDVESGQCIAKDYYGSKCSSSDVSECGGLHCDTELNMCVYCTANDHCSGGQICAKEKGACFAPPCQSHSDCNNEQGFICDIYYSTCTQLFCYTDKSCPKGLYCNLTSTESNENRRGVPCRPDVDCSDPTITGGLCAPIPCASNTDCGNSWLVCDTDSGHCARPKCSSAGACDDGLLCDKESGLCAACLSSDNCDSRWMCDSFLGECVPDYSHGGCHSDSDCPQVGCAVPVGGAPDSCPPDSTYVCDVSSGQCIAKDNYGSKCSSSDVSECGGLHCDTELNICVYCTANDHCSGGRICAKEKGVCFDPPCQSHSDCKEQQAVCDLGGSGSCQQMFCSSDADCKNGLFCNLTESENDGTLYDIMMPMMDPECKDAGCSGVPPRAMGFCEAIVCQSDEDCGSWVCNTESSNCVQPKCSPESDECEDNLLCNKESGYCVSCLSSTDCDNGMECEMMSGKCVVRTDEPPAATVCSSDDDCGDAVTCNTTTLTCVEDTEIKTPASGCVPNKGSCEAREECCKPDMYGCFGKKQDSFKCLKCAEKKMNCDTDEDCCGGGLKVKCHKGSCEKCGKAGKSCKLNGDCCSNSCEKKNRKGKRKCA